MVAQRGCTGGDARAHPAVHSRDQIQRYISSCYCGCFILYKYSYHGKVLTRHSAGLDTPFLLLPFRPNSDPRAARSFILNFFRAQYEHSGQYTGENLQHELRLTEPMVRAPTPASLVACIYLFALDFVQHHEMVLEQITRRCHNLGCL